MKRRTLTALALALAFAFADRAAPAAAPAPAPAKDDARREEAKGEFGQGNVDYNLGKYTEAIAHFEKAYSLSRVPEILFNLGQCYRKRWEADRKSELGRRALHYYQALVREAPGSRVRADADQFITELEPAVALAETKERQVALDAAHGAEALQLAQASFRDGRLAEAAAVADRLIAAPDSGRELLVEAYLVRGRAAAGLGDALAAEAQFRRALELRPAAELGDAQGAEAAAFEAARRTTAKDGGLRLTQAPAGEVPPGQPTRIQLSVDGDSEQLVTALELGYRRGDAGAFVTARVTAPAALAIPAAALTPGARVDYYVRALDAHGNVLAESGTPALPFRLQVAGAPGALIAARPADAPGGRQDDAPPPVYKRWWFWALVGAVAVGGTATYFGTRGGGGGNGGSTGDGLTTYTAATAP